MKVLTAGRNREVDRRTIEAGIPGIGTGVGGQRDDMMMVVARQL